MQSLKPSLSLQPAEPSQPPQCEEGPITALAEELLLLVFAGLDAPTLALAVPLVCRRWRRVAADPRAWAGADLVVQTNPKSEEDEDGPSRVDCQLCSDGLHGPLERALRALRKAPALRRLDLSGVHHCPRDYEVLLSLRRCRAAVREVVLPAEDLFVLNPERGVDLMLEFLSRSAPSLRALDVSLFLRSRKVERAVAELTGLQSLTVELRQDFKPCGALRGALPRLARLEVRNDPDRDLNPSCNLNRRSGRGVARLLADLVGGAAGTLRELLLHDDVAYYGVVGHNGIGPLPRAALAEARRCAGLRELHCDVEDLVLLPHLPALRTLRLHLMRRRGSCAFLDTDEHDPLEVSDEYSDDEDSDDEYFDEDVSLDVATLTSAAAALQGVGPLLSLREVTVEVTLHEGGGRGLAAMGLLEALADVAPAVTSLRVCFSWEPLFPVASILSRLLRLRRVWTCCTVDALDALAALPDLQEVHANVYEEGLPGELNHPDCDDIRRQRRERLEAAVAAARARRPTVQWNLRVTEYFW